MVPDAVRKVSRNRNWHWPKKEHGQTSCSAMPHVIVRGIVDEVPMLESDTPILRTFVGQFFAVQVWLSWLPPHHRVFVEALDGTDGVELFERGFPCSPEQLGELFALLKLALPLIAFLNEGGNISQWCENCAAQSKCSEN